MIGGLDSGDGVEADAFIRGVEAGVGDAKAGGGGEVEAGKVVADVGGSGDLGRQLDTKGVGGVDDRCAECGVGGEGVGGPAGAEFDEEGGPDAGPGIVDLGDEIIEQSAGVFAGKGGSGANVDVEGAQVRGDRVALAAGDGGDGELAGQWEPGGATSNRHNIRHPDRWGPNQTVRWGQSSR